MCLREKVVEGVEITFEGVEITSETTFVGDTSATMTYLSRNSVKRMFLAFKVYGIK